MGYWYLELVFLMNNDTSKQKNTSIDVGTLSCKWEVFKDEVKPRNDNSDNLYTIKDDFK